MLQGLLVFVVWSERNGRLIGPRRADIMREA
jgi:hypothetical protein